MIYFIQAVSGGPIKIGHTNKQQCGHRLTGLQVGNPEMLSLLFSYHGCERSEAALHARFDYAHLRGEWFHPVPELLDHIDRMRGTKKPHADSLLAAFLARHGLDCDGTLPALRALAPYAIGKGVIDP